MAPTIDPFFLTHPRHVIHFRQLLERTLRVDHKAKYALPKEIVEKEEQKEKEVGMLCIHIHISTRTLKLVSVYIIS